MREEELLISRLKNYDRTDMYPFHMPGHKRLKAMEEKRGERDFPNPLFIDITEIEGFDNLHHPEGILKKSMEWAAEIYGADRTRYLVNGSTCGILAAVCGCVPRGGRLLMSRNCHKSVYNAVYLNQLKTSYVYPQHTAGLGIQGGIAAEDVENLLRQYGDTKAVFIVSPTYDGVVSDIRAIADIVHQAGLPLIVDEAHGAHFRYRNEFPKSALELGADVVIQSVHKTLPCLTQTAVIHIKCRRPDGGCYADADAIERYLHIYQSSSPSYVLMASIEKGIFEMEKICGNGGKSQISAYLDSLSALRRRLAGMRHLRLVNKDIVGTAGIYDLDCTKVVVSTRGTDLDGVRLGDILRKEFHLEMEMCGPDYVTAITTVMDSAEGLRRLGDALTAVDERQESGIQTEKEMELPGIYSQPNEAVMTISEAADSRACPAALEESEGRISSEFVYIYPPGIPILAPGERVSRRVLTVIRDYIRKGLPVQGPADESLKTIMTVKEQ
ncbi:MAG: aminotransferase class I/II-fold pyridoxal phosphate-dependent enzyme [Enterocloster sp.]